MNFPTLYKLTSTGKVQLWYIRTIDNFIYTTFGLLDGKQQTAIEEIKDGKNVGKVNETTPIQQAELEAQAQWEKKKKNKGYVESIEAAKAGERDASVAGGIDPMLAHKYEDQSHKIKWPAYVQPKLDGHRCIAIIQNGKATLWSRQRKPILSMPHIVAALEQEFPTEDIILDGELYNHDYREKFEELTSLIRKQKPAPGHEVVQYWVYDIVSSDPFENRSAMGFHFLGSNAVVPVPTTLVKDEAEMIAVFGAYVAEGYEGAMVRNAASLYKNGRSYDLQKVKVFQDAEFEIVDVVPGKGKMGDKGVFVCVTEEGKEFKAKMVGSLDNLRKYLDNKEDYIGKQLTVKFQKWSADKVPVFGVAMRIREDL
jgi:DNA ligase 1